MYPQLILLSGMLNKWDVLCNPKWLFFPCIFSYSRWKIVGFLSGVQNEEADSIPKVITTNCLDFQRKHDPMVPCPFLNLPGAWGRRKAKQSSRRMLRPVSWSLMHSRMDMKNALLGACLLCRNGSLPGSKTKISASKNLCFQKLWPLCHHLAFIKTMCRWT